MTSNGYLKGCKYFCHFIAKGNKKESWILNPYFKVSLLIFPPWVKVRDILVGGVETYTLIKTKIFWGNNLIQIIWLNLLLKTLPI
jgi:hypothetical protein